MKIDYFDNLPNHFSKRPLPIFLTQRYRDFFKDSRKGSEFIWFFTDNMITSFALFKKLGFKIARPEYGVYSLREVNESDEKSFLTEIINTLHQKLKVDYILNGGVYSMTRVVPDIKRVRYSAICTFVIDLSLNEEEIFSRIHSKHRNVIRKAQKMGVKIVRGLDQYKTALEIVNMSRKRSGIDLISVDRIEKIIENMEENVEFFVAYLEDIPQASAIFIFTEYSSYYLYGGTIYKPTSGASNLLHWEAIKYFKKLRVKKYDFMGARCNPLKGTKHYNIRKFKSRFGGDEIKGYIWRSPLKPIKGGIFENLYKLFYKSDIIWEEKD